MCDKVKALKRELNDTEEKIRVMRSILLDIEQKHRLITANLLKTCNHEVVSKERQYYSGMHSSEYYYKCELCDQPVTDKIYYNATDQRII